MSAERVAAGAPPSELRRVWSGGRLRLAALWHQLRWRPRFAEFGWRSTLRAPDMLTRPDRVRIGSHVEIRKGARIEAVGPGEDVAVEIGDGTSIHLYFHVGAAREVTIGKNVLIAGHVYVTDHDHELSGPGQPRAGLVAAPTRIDDDCWLAEGCKILKGVHLGQGCVVGANAVVTRSFPAYTVLAGVPARPLRRFDPAVGDWVPWKEGS